MPLNCFVCTVHKSSKYNGSHGSLIDIYTEVCQFPNETELLTFKVIVAE